MSVIEDVRCESCGEPLNDQEQCLNINCERAVRQATAGAARATHKATAVATAAAPNAFTSSGRVD